MFVKLEWGSKGVFQGHIDLKVMAEVIRAGGTVEDLYKLADSETQSTGFVVSKQENPNNNTEVAKERFKICKGCDKSSQGGFKCSLHKGCCFGKWRTKPESKCYEGKW